MDICIYYENGRVENIEGIDSIYDVIETTSAGNEHKLELVDAHRKIAVNLIDIAQLKIYGGDY